MIATYRSFLPTVLFAVLATALSVPVAAAQQGPAAFDRQVVRLLAGQTGIDTTSPTARCLRTQSLRALRSGAAPKAARTAKVCKTGQVTVSKIIRGTLSAGATAKRARSSAPFKRALFTNAYLSVASKTVNGRRLVVALSAASRAGGTGTPGHGAVPTAAFTPTISGRTVTFDASQSADDKGIVSYDWRLMAQSSTGVLGPAVTGKGVTFTHTAAAYGDYRVTLTVTDADKNTSNLSRSINLNDGTREPSAFYVRHVDYRISQRTVILDGSGSSGENIVSYDWYLTDVGIKTHIGTGARIVWTAPASGFYGFLLVVTDAVGRTDEYTMSRLDVTDRRTRAEFMTRITPTLDAERTEYNLPLLTESTCLSQMAQQQSETLADKHAGAPALDLAAISAACGVTVRGGVAHYDESRNGDYLGMQMLTSSTAMTAYRTRDITQYGVGAMHSLNGLPGYYGVFLTAS